MMTQQELTERLSEIYKTALAISAQKSNDYASDDDGFANFRFSSNLTNIPVVLTILSRFGDKLSRLRNALVEHKTLRVEDEKVRDTIIDAINYLALMLVAWEKEQEK